MSWVRLDDQFFAHPKIVDLPKDAKLLYLAGLTYCAQQLTDGRLTPGAVRMLGALVEVDNAPPLITALINAGLWETYDGGWQVHDYLEYNPSAEKVKAEREASAQRVHNWRDKRRAARNGTSNGVTSEQSNSYITVTSPPRNGNAQSNAVTSGVGNGVRNADVTVPPVPYPVPYPYEESGEYTPREDTPVVTAPTPTRSEPPPPVRSVPKRAAGATSFAITPALRAWAAEHEPGVDVDREAGAFLDWVQANGKTYKDWDAAFRGWLRKAPAYASSNGHGNGQSRAGPTGRPIASIPIRADPLAY